MKRLERLHHLVFSLIHRLYIYFCLVSLRSQPVESTTTAIRIYDYVQIGALVGLNGPINFAVKVRRAPTSTQRCLWDVHGDIALIPNKVDMNESSTPDYDVRGHVSQQTLSIFKQTCSISSSNSLLTRECF